MRIIAKRTLREYWETHADARGALEAWFHEVEKADWTNPADLAVQFPRTSLLPGDRAIFRLRGNHLRLVVAIRYGSRLVFIRFVGTHAEYDRIDAATV